MTFQWTDGTINRAAVLLSEGLTASQIAERLGCSRNAVIGKVTRHAKLREIGFKGRPGGQHTPRIKRHVRRVASARAKAKAPSVPAAEHVAAVKLRVMRRLSLLEVGHFQCRWPVEGERAGMIVCGADVEPDCPRLFCPEHYQLSCGAGTASERAAGRAV